MDRTNAVKGHLEPMLLAILETESRHGYAIIEELRRRSQGTFDLPEGTVYPALHRLERQGLLRSRWSAENARRRRVYEITRTGRTALAGDRSAWRGFAAAIGNVLGDAHA